MSQTTSQRKADVPQAHEEGKARLNRLLLKSEAVQLAAKEVRYLGFRPFSRVAARPVTPFGLICRCRTPSRLRRPEILDLFVQNRCLCALATTTSASFLAPRFQRHSPFRLCGRVS